MKYLHIKTNSLVDLVGRNTKDQIDWLAIGTNAKLINLNPISVGQHNADGITCYILPVADETKALNFIATECETYGIEAEVIDEAQATTHKAELDAYRESLKAS
jgi:hypothetical protein